MFPESFSSLSKALPTQRHMHIGGEYVNFTMNIQRIEWVQFTINGPPSILGSLPNINPRVSSW